MRKIFQECKSCLTYLETKASHIDIPRKIVVTYMYVALTIFYYAVHTSKIICLYIVLNTNIAEFGCSGFIFSFDESTQQNKIWNTHYCLNISANSLPFTPICRKRISMTYIYWNIHVNIRAIYRNIHVKIRAIYRNIHVKIRAIYRNLQEKTPLH